MRLTLLRVALLAAGALHCLSQDSLPTPPADVANLTGLTTPIEVQFSDGRLVQGSGFFYYEFAPDDKKGQGPHWVAIKNMYVVTAKHVVQPNRLNQLVKFTYAIRVGTQDGVAWHRIELDRSELSKRLHLCHNESVDVAVVDVTGNLNTEEKNLIERRAQMLAPNSVFSDRFPDKSEIHVQPGDDVIVIGYPLGFFDTFNKLPILKTGILNTPVGLHFNGLDAFLIDFRYYEGSSGSLIISKPTRIAINKTGQIEIAASPEYVFLGVYGGEEYWNDAVSLRPDLGLGWYYYNVEEAIRNPPLTH